MSKHNFFAKFFKKTNIFINSLLKKKLNKLNFIFEKDKFLTFLSFKRAFMFLSALIVLTFSYLSIPNFYDTSNLINNIKNQLYKDLNIILVYQKNLVIIYFQNLILLSGNQIFTSR